MQGVLKLASRFGKTYHRSYVRRKLEQSRACAPESTGSFEEWLIKLAKLRANKVPGAPSLRDVPNEELTVALLLLENLDHQGLLESAAVMLSRLAVDQKELARLAKQERVDFLLSALTGEASRK